MADTEIINMMADKIAKLEEAQQWIPCSVSLPELKHFKECKEFTDEYSWWESDLCLTVDEDGDMRVAFYERYDEDGETDWYCPSEQDGVVPVAWMPIEPWKGDEE